MELEEIKNVLLDICIYKGDKDGLTAEEYSAIKSAGDYLTKQDKMIELLIEDLQGEGCLNMSREEIDNYYERRMKLAEEAE